MLTECEKKYIELSILYYNKYRQDKDLTGIIIKQMRLDNGLL